MKLKIFPEDEITGLYKTGKFSMAELADTYDCSPYTICNIVNKTGSRRLAISERNQIGLERDNRESQIAELFKQGMTCVQIGLRFNISSFKVLRIVHKKGIRVGRGSRQKGIPKGSYYFSLEDELNITAKYQHGMNSVQIAKESGCTGPTIISILKKNGIEIHKRSGNAFLTPYGQQMVKNRGWNHFYKNEIFAYFNFTCSLCKLQDFVHIDIFGLDHTNNDAHHYLTGVKGGQKLYRDLYYGFVSKNFPILNIYQLLCHNCNWKKHLEYLKVFKHGPQYDRQTRYRNKLKIECFSHYSPNLICQCCGCDNFNILQMAHIEPLNDSFRPTGVEFYRYVIASGFIEGLKVLCPNCNMYESMNNNKCFHQELKEKEAKESIAMAM